LVSELLYKGLQDSLTYGITAAGKCASQLGDTHTQRFEVHVELDEEGLGEGVAPLEGVHGGEEEPQRIGRLAVVWPALEVLHEYPS
jgi:hypothetical protein